MATILNVELAAPHLHKAVRGRLLPLLQMRADFKIRHLKCAGQIAMTYFIVGVLMTLVPSFLIVAWLVWREGVRRTIRHRS